MPETQTSSHQGLVRYVLHIGGLADKVQGHTMPSDRPNFFIYTRREPIGVVGAITPWNSPGLLLIFKLAPGLAAGCTFVVKPSEHASASTIELARRLDEAGFPPGVFNCRGGPAARSRGLQTGNTSSVPMDEAMTPGHVPSPCHTATSKAWTDALSPDWRVRSRRETPDTVDESRAGAASAA